MRKQTVYVVAPNRFRFVAYCTEKEIGPINTGARLLNRAKDLFGVRGQVEFAPGYDRVPEYHELARGLKRKALMGDITVPDWWLRASAGGE